MEQDARDEDADSKKEVEGARRSPKLVGGDGAGWCWINWLRAGLRDGAIAVNAEGAWLYNIVGEAYVVVPDGFEAFAMLEGVEAETAKNRVARLGRHRECSSASGAANIFRAELADGRRVEGIVLPGDLVWDNDPPPEASGKLGLRRR